MNYAFFLIFFQTIESDPPSQAKLEKDAKKAAKKAEKAAKKQQEQFAAMEVRFPGKDCSSKHVCDLVF